jgi:hypothetical protein
MCSGASLERSCRASHEFHSRDVTTSTIGRHRCAGRTTPSAEATSSRNSAFDSVFRHPTGAGSLRSRRTLPRPPPGRCGRSASACDARVLVVRCSRGVVPGDLRGVQARTGAENAHSSNSRPLAATSAGIRADGSCRTPASDATRSPASVSAPRPAHIRTADGELSDLVAASSPPTPSTASRTAKLRVMSVSRRVPSDRPLSRFGAIINATPIATLIPPNAPTTNLELTLTIALNVARPTPLDGRLSANAMNCWHSLPLVSLRELPGFAVDTQMSRRCSGPRAYCRTCRMPDLTR